LNETIKSLSKGGIYGGMEEVFIAMKYLKQDIYVFNNNFSLRNVLYFESGTTKPPIVIYFKG